MTAGRLVVRHLLETYEHHCSDAANAAPTGDRALVGERIEELIQIGLGCFTTLEMAEIAWRRHVSRGNRAADLAEDAWFREAYAQWSMDSDRLLAAAAPFAELVGVTELGFARVKTDQKLEKWSTPHPSTLIGLRAVRLSPAAADELRAIAAEAEGLPTSPLDAPEMLELTKDEFLARTTKG